MNLKNSGDSTGFEPMTISKHRTSYNISFITQFKHTFDYTLKLLENTAVTRLGLFKKQMSYPADKSLTTGIKLSALRTTEVRSVPEISNCWIL